jgi:hypothetical protein
VPVSEWGLTRDRLSGVLNSRLSVAALQIKRRCKRRGWPVRWGTVSTPLEMQLADGNETKACDLSAAPAGLKRADRLFEPMICWLAHETVMYGMLHLRTQPSKLDVVWGK